MRFASLSFSLCAVALLASVPLASAAAEPDKSSCLFGYDPNADLNVCYEVGTYQEPSYVYTIEFQCTVQVGQQCFGAPYFQPLYEGQPYEVPFVHVWYDDGFTYCRGETNVAGVFWTEEGARCPTHVSSQGVTVIVFDVAPL